MKKRLPAETVFKFTTDRDKRKAPARIIVSSRSGRRFRPKPCDTHAKFFLCLKVTYNEEVPNQLN